MMKFESDLQARALRHEKLTTPGKRRGYSASCRAAAGERLWAWYVAGILWLLAAIGSVLIILLAR